MVFVPEDIGSEPGFSIMPRKTPTDLPGIEVIDNPRQERTAQEQRTMPHIYRVCGLPAAYIIVTVTGNTPACHMCALGGIESELSRVKNAGSLIGVRYAINDETCAVAM